MRNLPVHWFEGMFLRPQHFQAAERYWTEVLQTSEQWDHPYNYGLRSIALSSEAIANFQIDLTACKARLKDGTLVVLEAGQQPDRVNLKEGVSGLSDALASLEEAFQTETVIRVYLGVPKLKIGRPNVGNTEGGGQHRYVKTKLALQDESFGGNDQEIELRGLNARLLLSTQDLSGYELLPIGQIKRASETEAAPQLDEDYIPPVLAVDAWPPLSRDYVRAVYDIIGQKIQVLSDQVVNRGITLASQEPGDLERLLMLSVLNEAYATLHCMAFAVGLHPLIVYTELCRIVGSLSLYGKERRPPEIPHYDHDDLARIFKWAKRQISDYLYSVRDYVYEQRFFIGAGRGLQVALDPKWLGHGWEWYVGVNRGNISEAECRELLSQLDWKVGSAEQVDLLFKTRATGVQLVESTTTPRALPAGAGWIYHEVRKQGPAWNHVVAKQSLAMRFQEHLIANLSELQGKRQVVVSHRGRQATLQFALFAVPQHQ